MEQITKPLTAKIKPGHGVMMLSFYVDNEDNGDLVINLNKTKNEFEVTDKFQAFLDTCFGSYTINSSEWSVTFEDSRDFMHYQLAVADGEIWLK